MTGATQDNEVFFCVWSSLAAANDVVNLQLIAPATVLAFPSIALQNAFRELGVLLWIEPNWALFPNLPAHADCLTSIKNCCCCAAGRNPKNRCNDISSTSAFPFSRFAPARKSAQIISRQ